jgi:hypothetical protein
MSLHTHFSAAVGNSFGYTLIRLAGEGRNKSNSCLWLLARSVPTCPPEVDDAHGLFFVRGLIANMATIPKPVVPACDWREIDPLLTPQQVAKRLNTSLDWVWDHSSRKMPLVPVILIEFRDSWIVRFRLNRVPDCWWSTRRRVRFGLVGFLRNAASQRLKDDTSPQNGCCTVTCGYRARTI